MGDERDLLQRARAYDQAALARIYDEYSPRIYRYAWQLLGDEVLAEECVADSFSRFLQALRNKRGVQDHLQAYLYRIAHNWITDRYRRQPPAALELSETLPDPGNDPPTQTEGNMRRQQLCCALYKLTAEQRQVVVLKYLEGLSNEEIARSVGRPVTAVKALQHRALAALRRLLPAEEIYG